MPSLSLSLLITAVERTVTSAIPRGAQSMDGQGLRVLGCASIRVITMTVFPQLKDSPLSFQHFSFAIRRHSTHNVM